MCGHKPKLKQRNSRFLVCEPHSDKSTCYRRKITTLTCSLEETSWSCQLSSFLLYIAQNCLQTCLQGVGDGTGRCPCEKETGAFWLSNPIKQHPTMHPFGSQKSWKGPKRSNEIPSTLQDSLNHPLQMTDGSSTTGLQSLSKSQLLEPIPQGEAGSKHIKLWLVCSCRWINKNQPRRDLAICVAV